MRKQLETFLYGRLSRHEFANEVLSSNVRNFGLLDVSRSCCFSSGGYPPELKIWLVPCC